MVQHGPMKLLIVSENESELFFNEIKSFYQKFSIEVSHSNLEFKTFSEKIASISSESNSWILFLNDSYNITYSEHLNVIKESFHDQNLKFIVGDRYLNKAGIRKPIFRHWAEQLAHEKLQKSLNKKIVDDVDYFSPLVAISTQFFLGHLNNEKFFNQKNSLASPFAYRSLKAALNLSARYVFVPTKAESQNFKVSYLEILKVLFLPVAKSDSL